MLVNQLAKHWIPALPEIEARRRRTDPPARIADLGCGSGWSTIALAKAFPAAHVDGIDLDEASIEDARRCRRERSHRSGQPRLPGRRGPEPGGR
jgi:trans-aconitate methyltransferase